MENGQASPLPETQAPEQGAQASAQEAPVPAQQAPAAEGPAPRPTMRESLYRHFDKVPLKALDAFIAVCVVAFFAVIAVGVAQAHGFL